MNTVNNWELQALRAEVKDLRQALADHLLKCADANGRLDLKMRVALYGLFLLVILVAPENPLVKAALTAVGVHR